MNRNRFIILFAEKTKPTGLMNSLKVKRVKSKVEEKKGEHMRLLRNHSTKNIFHRSPI